MTRIIHEKGCVDCGCEHSFGWHHLPPKQVVAELHQQRCADCQGRHDKTLGIALPCTGECVSQKVVDAMGNGPNLTRPGQGRAS